VPHKVARFFLVRDTKTGKYVPNQHKNYQNFPNGLKIFQMAIKYINIFPTKDLKKFPKEGFLV
jgi:hypothetical protein